MNKSGTRESLKKGVKIRCLTCPGSIVNNATVKQFTLALTLLFSFSLMVQAGPEPAASKDKTVMDISPACDFYRAHEWDLSIWGTYVFSGDQGHNNVSNDDPFSPDLDPEILVSSFFGSTGTDDIVEPKNLNPNERVDLGQVSSNSFLGRDDSWGGGIDVKYFWSKYFGAGLEGFVVETVKGAGGSGLVTFTGRYPIGRFAPYAFAGAGFLAGGGRVDRVFYETHTYGEFFTGPMTPPIDVVTGEEEHIQDETIENKHVYFNGQLGVGVEFRLTCHVGIMADFTWNFVAGQDDGDKSVTHTSPGGECFTCAAPATPSGTAPPSITFDSNIAHGIVPGEKSDDKDFGMVRFGLTFSY